MIQQSKFDLSKPETLEEQVIDWTEQFFFNLMNVLNSFYSRVDVEDSLTGLKGIDFGKLVLEQLEDESEAVKAIAVARINQMAAEEIEYIRI